MEDLYKRTLNDFLLQKSYSHIRLSESHYLYGFSSDIILHITTNKSTLSNHTSPIKIVNIEIDGPAHNFHPRKYFATLRDHYLQHVYGVEIIRVPLYDYKNGITKSKMQNILSKLLQKFKDY